MSAEFVIPDWMTPAEPPPPSQPDTTDVDPHRVEALVNRFIAAKQDALFEAPDAYYRQTGGDAVDGAPAILDRLNALRDGTLDQADDDGLRAALGRRLGLHLADAADGIDRHAAAQRDVLNRQIVAERQRLIQRAAEFEHTDDGKLAGLAEANASAALELARMNGAPESPAIDAARSAIWKTAIDRRLANSDGPQAITLFDKVKDQLAPADRLALDTPLQVARNTLAADQWIANQTATDGPPLQDRVVADSNLSPDAKLIVRAKLDARDSAAQSKRAVTAKALDDQIADTIGILASSPGTYKPGTLARIANGYADANEPDKAAAIRRVATQEAVLIPFAQSSASRQHALIDSLPDSELRDAATAIQHQQVNALTISDASPEPFHDGDQLAQSILPFLGKPPYYVPPKPPGPVTGPTKGVPKTPSSEPPQGSAPTPPGGADTPREYKVPIPRQSGKESKNDVPGEYKAIRPYRGEKPRETAKRAMDQIQGKDNWNHRTREGLFEKLKKFYGSHYKDPKEILPPPIVPTDITGRDIEASLPDPDGNGAQSSVA